MRLALDALLFATERHGDQKRKYTNDPYILHPIRVAQQMERHGFCEEVIAAAFLHDVCEDCGVTPGDIERAFGALVGNLVEQVTDRAVSTDGNRAKRTAINLAHLTATDYMGASLKLADIIDNMPSIVMYDLRFANVYIPETVAQIKVLRHGHPLLLHRAIELSAWAMTEIGAQPQEKQPKEDVDG